MPSLQDPIRIGALDLPNRIIMAPLTRSRASAGRVPNSLMRDYYVQRASAGLIISEATSVTPMGVGYLDTPGIWSREQVEGWKLVTSGVHAAGGRIVMQLWHVGRISHSSLLGGALPVAPSAVAPEGVVRLLRPQPAYEVPRALALDEIPGIIEAYRSAALHAKEAGFDGVEIHGANGYLLDQFLQRSANRRADHYGGSVENRARLMLEVTDAVISVWGAERVGMHLSLKGDVHSMGDPDLPGTFTYVARELDARGIAFICARESQNEPRIAPLIRNAYKGVFIANEGLTGDSAETLLHSGEADAAAFGKLFICNPDLPLRFARNAALNAWDDTTFYTGGARGYTDYPSLDEKSA